MGGLIARFLPSLVPGLSAFLNPWVLLGVIAAASACFGAGVMVEGWRLDASETEKARDQINSLMTQARKDAVVNADVAALLADDRAELDADRQEFDKEKRRVPKTQLVEVDCPKPDASGAAAVADAGPSAPAAAALGGDGPRARLSADAVRLWNIALGVGLPDAYGDWGVDGAMPPAGGARIQGDR